MSKLPVIPVWKAAPFLRILPPFITGILLQWNLQLDILLLLIAAGCFMTAYFLFSLLPDTVKFKILPVRGIFLMLLLLTAGALLGWKKDIRHNSNWYGNYYNDSSFIVVRIEEPLIEKAKSYKADGYVEAVINDRSITACKGKLLLYFSKESDITQLEYGDKILISKKILAIKNNGNPGGFNYERYAAFQQIFHNVFLKQKDWIKLEETDRNRFQQFIFQGRSMVLTALQKFVGNSKDELGIAEALLIGYTNDLDKDLVQAYSNTGVVHIIAISGMHLGLIYVLLIWLFAKVPYIKRSKWLEVSLVLTCLWLFSLLTGGSASVLRSAVMFSFITFGKTFFRQTSIFNSLAVSAFCMLLYNPFYLWDVGFQLSYLAVVGIVIFQKPIYNLLYIKNKWIDTGWKLVAVTTAAQILTFPVCIYYFHQFPLLFLITNLIAVPLSTVILYSEIFLVAFSWIPVVGVYAGKLTTWLVWLMNQVILSVNKLPFAVWDKIPSTLLTTWLLYTVVVFAAAWLLNRSKLLLRLSLLFLTGFLLAHAVINWQVKNQQKIIVYNVPQQQAIDFVSGNNYQFFGDSVMLKDGLLQNFHLKPGRIALQLDKRTDTLPGLFNKDNFFEFAGQRIFIADGSVTFAAADKKVNIDVIIISKNPKLYIAQLLTVFDCGQIVFDASNSLWKIEKWKQDCLQLNLRHHSIPEQGAFVLNID
ncbi:MAG: ComEC/Rec2 family competence protein [Ferruginibacter sp.]